MLKKYLVSGLVVIISLSACSSNSSESNPNSNNGKSSSSHKKAKPKLKLVEHEYTKNVVQKNEIIINSHLKDSLLKQEMKIISKNVYKADGRLIVCKLLRTLCINEADNFEQAKLDYIRALRKLPNLPGLIK